MKGARWETKVDKFLAKAGYLYNPSVLFKSDAIALLRREHAAVVRKIKGVIAKEIETMTPTLAATDWGKGYKNGLLNVRAKLLAALATRKGGG